jgi:vacuolar-type H+-ATPase subunit F/Vma7
MGRVVVIGEQARVAGFALAGAEVRRADDADAMRAAWPAGESDVTVVILTPAAAAATDPDLDLPPTPARPLVVVLP